MEDFKKKLSMSSESMAEPEVEAGEESEGNTASSPGYICLLRRFLQVQKRRAEAYSKLKKGFSEYTTTRGEVAYQNICSEVTEEFSDCSKQVLHMESLFQSPEYNRADLARLLRAIQMQEKQKLHLTARIQVLKKAGYPSERLVSHENCKFAKPMEHECMHVHEITEAAGTEEAEADAEYDHALKEAIKGVQESVTAINEHLEEVRYEIDALESA